jgi:alpha-1,6-mannosyltransferase
VISLWKYHKFSFLLIGFCLLLYVFFAYDLNRIETTNLLGYYFALFIFTYLLVKSAKSSFGVLILASVLFRFVFLFALPSLSQDFYRFIWDGRMLLEGLNPYLYVPKSFGPDNIPIAQGQKLILGMGELSASNYSNYPPLKQLCFGIATYLSGSSILGSVIVMRLFIIAADIGILYFGSKLLAGLKLPKSRIFWYALNPLIIIELTGNLHFEGVMLFFYFSACIYYNWENGNGPLSYLAVPLLLSSSL